MHATAVSMHLSPETKLALLVVFAPVLAIGGFALLWWYG